MPLGHLAITGLPAPRITVLGRSRRVLPSCGTEEGSWAQRVARAFQRANRAEGAKERLAQAASENNSPCDVKTDGQAWITRADDPDAAAVDLAERAGSGPQTGEQPGSFHHGFRA